MTKKILLDTNILIYLSDTTSPFFISQPEKIFQNHQLFLSDRSLLEFYRTFTGYLKHSSEEALKVVNFYITNDNWTILYSDMSIEFLTFQLAEKYNAKSGKIFDLNILATALENNIDILYTKNTKDYPENSEIQIIDPTL